jgi:hypothetical protein
MKDRGIDAFWETALRQWHRKSLGQVLNIKERNCLMRNVKLLFEPEIGIIFHFWSTPQEVRNKNWAGGIYKYTWAEKEEETYDRTDN